MFAHQIFQNYEIIALTQLTTVGYLFTLWAAAPYFAASLSQTLRSSHFFFLLMLNLCGLPPLPLFFFKFWLVAVIGAHSVSAVIVIIFIVNIATTTLYLFTLRRFTTLNSGVPTRHQIRVSQNPYTPLCLFLWGLVTLTLPWVFI